jgi:hypothetical protein
MGAVAGDSRRAATHTVAAAPYPAAPLPILGQGDARVWDRPVTATPHSGRKWAQPAHLAAGEPPPRHRRPGIFVEHLARGGGEDVLEPCARAPTCASGRRKDPRIRCGRHSGRGPRAWPHHGQPHRQPPDRLRLASGEPRPTAGHGGPWPQLGSGDPVRPAGWGWFYFD